MLACCSLPLSSLQVLALSGLQNLLVQLFVRVAGQGIRQTAAVSILELRPEGAEVPAGPSCVTDS